MTIKRIGLIAAAAAVLGFGAQVVNADDHPYSEGEIVNIAKIRTADGHTEEYMKWLDSVWKQEQEAAKKAGYLTGYEVLTVEARGPDDPDILLITRYKNWASLDGSIAKGDAVSKMVEGSATAAAQSEADRGKIRRVLGSETTQAMMLK